MTFRVLQASALLTLLLAAGPLTAQRRDPRPVELAANAVVDSNAVLTNASTEPKAAARAPVNTPRKTRAGFLAAAGLVILSLLLLASGMALLRAFKQR